MRKFLLFCILFFAFTFLGCEQKFSKELPQEIFGFSLYNNPPALNYSSEYEVIYPNQTFYGLTLLNPLIKNTNFDSYYILTNQQNEIHKIVGLKTFDAPDYTSLSKAKYDCQEVKSEMITFYEDLYNLLEFKHIYLVDDGSSSGMDAVSNWYNTHIRDHHYYGYEINNKEYVLSISCIYSERDSRLQIELSSKLYDDLFQKDYISSKIFDPKIF